MDSATEELYFQKISDLVLDEEKIITTLSLAAELKISLTESQNLMNKYLKDQRTLKPGEIASTYLLSGNLKGSKGLAIYLVKESDLVQKREFFETVASEVIYSLQKCKNIDQNVIALVECNIDDPTCHGIPVSVNCVKRIASKKVIIAPPQTSTTIKDKQPSSFFKKLEQPKVEANGKTEEKKSQSQNVKQSKAKGGITNFFAKAVTQQKVKEEINKDVKENIKEGVQSTMKENSVNEGNKVEIEKMDVDDSDNEQQPIKKKENEKPKKSNNSSKKRKKDGKTNDLPNKKRKRIQEIIDSDSSDIFEEDDEDIIEKSDEEEIPIPIPAKKIVEPVTNKRRKAVDKTYMDEEGFIVTTTEYVYESGSDVEGEKSAKEVKQVEEKPKVFEKKNSTTDSETDGKTSAGKGKKNNKKPVSGKQPTLMSFFKKA